MDEAIRAADTARRNSSTHPQQGLSPLPATWTSLDSMLLLALLFGTLLAVAKGVLWNNLPAEDALMLMRYANHLAAGYGIVWNIGDKPVEGATDFLYLILLSGWIKLSHLGAVWASRTFLATAHVVSVLALYVTARRVAGAGAFTAFTLALYLAMGPGLTHTSNGFSSPFYGLMALLAWAFALAAFLSGPTLTRTLGFAIFALLAGLTRPDGVMLAIFMSAAIVYGLRRASLRMVATTAAIFLVFGGAYFLWRFHYFGYLLPNPMYKKGGGRLYLDSLHASTTNCLKMLLPVLPVFLAGLFVKSTRRLAIFTIIPLAAFACVWVLLTNENNASMRFQYVVLPFGLLSAAAIVSRLPAFATLAGKWQPARWQLAASVALLLVAFHLFWLNDVRGPEEVGTGPYHIATGLAKFENKHYTLVATEAGVIPYFSRWRTIDAWGLNDAEIAHNKRGITDGYLDQNHPAVIMVHNSTFVSKADYDRAWRGDAPPAQTSTYLVESASHYAKEHGYTLAARWGRTACETDMWYVKADNPDAAELLRIIRQPGYFYPYNDAPDGTNFLTSDPPVACEDHKNVLTRHD